MNLKNIHKLIFGLWNSLLHVFIILKYKIYIFFLISNRKLILTIKKKLFYLLINLYKLIIYLSLYMTIKFDLNIL